MSVICFDLEGPLSPQDNAYEVMGLVPEGEKIFEVLSRYDDLLTLGCKEGYEPGSTLALIVPFLIYHHISEEDIKKVSDKARLVDGAAELIERLRYGGWRVYIISTSYEQHAHNIGKKVGVERENIVCTKFPLNRYYEELKELDWSIIERAEKDILALYPPEPEKDEKIKGRLDDFFWGELSRSELGKPMEEVKVMGGERKVEAVKRIAGTLDKTLKDLAVVGDSITDFKMLQAVKEAGGLSIAFNANEYALPYGNVGLASTNLSDLWVILEAWNEGRMKAVEKLVKDKQREGGRENRNHFQWLLDCESFEEPLKIHKGIRQLVRREAAKLG